MANIGRLIFLAASTCCLTALFGCVDVNGISVDSATVPVATATIKNTDLDKEPVPATAAPTTPPRPSDPPVPVPKPSSTPTLPPTNTSASTFKPTSNSTSVPTPQPTPTPSTTTASTKPPPKWAKWASKSKKAEEDSVSVSSSESDEEDDEGNDAHDADQGEDENNDEAEESYEEKIVLGKEKDFRTAALEFINYYRSSHGAPALIIDPVLNTQAQTWATNLADTNTLDYSCTPDLTPVTTTWKIKPSSKCKYSEGIALVEGNENLSTAARAAVQQWYREGLKYSYKYGAPTPTATTGKNVLDFTAMLWKGSKKVGFGLATDKNGEIVFVANYSPAGNVAGQYGKNVLP